MRVVEYHANDDVRIVDLPVPDIQPGELLVQLQACGICASDVMEWYMQPRAPLYPGHEPVGVVVAVGTGVQQFTVGQHVFFHHHVPCMVCHFCQSGHFRSARRFVRLGSILAVWRSMCVCLPQMSNVMRFFCPMKFRPRRQRS